MYWDKIVLMIGPFGDWIKFSYDEPIFLSSEIDGIRITSNDKCELLQKVPSKYYLLKNNSIHKYHKVYK